MLTVADIYSSGKADSCLQACLLKWTRHAHQVTLAKLLEDENCVTPLSSNDLRGWTVSGPKVARIVQEFEEKKNQPGPSRASSGPGVICRNRPQWGF